ncbi:MAG: DUF5312 family protein [Treponema sp.]|jgi:hypothetical protein|nr:DUF5312 family protein [Treponema sp.]
MAEDLIEKVFSLFSGDNAETHLSDKEVVLKQRLKDLTENKYVRFFRPKTDEADPSLGQFFYTLYKMILPIRTFMQDVAQTTRLRQIVLEAFMDAGIVETAKKLSPAVIEERFKKTPPAELITEISADIDKLVAGFDSSRIDGVNRCYDLVTVVFQLAHFDYPALLKKFDSNFTEGPFSGDPKFFPVKTIMIVKELGEFLAVAQNINPDSDWKALLKLLKSCAGKDLISEDQFAQILIGLRDVITSKVLELMVQYGSKNPVWTCKPRIPDEHIAENWLEARTSKAQECIDRINESETNKQIVVLLKEVFDNTEELERLENYTVAKSDVYRRKELSHYVYAQGLNYLSVFLSDYMEKEIRELSDILLIRGQWTNNTFSKEMSEALHELLDLPEAIGRLDGPLVDDGPDGSRLKAALLRFERDRTQARYINVIIDNINEMALELMNTAIEQISVVDRHLKSLVDDVQKKHPEMIVNWRELGLFSKDPLAQRIVDASKKISCFTELMNLCIQ